MFRSVGPAIIVAAVVLGPGSILTSSKVGASLGLLGIPVVVAAAVLMMAMVALAARLGVSYEGSLCDELAARLGRPIPILIGITLFTLVALFQSSNNIALIGGLEPMVGVEAWPFEIRAALLIAVNAAIIGMLYLSRNLYRLIEGLMKLLVGLMALAFVINFVLVLLRSSDGLARPLTVSESAELLPLLGMIGTTFSVGGAFYQAYLVKERGWGAHDIKQGTTDAIVSISVLGLVTCVILATSALVFFPRGASLATVGDVAVQLEPTFGPSGKAIFCLGILAGGLSSFLVNAMIGGTVLSDSLGAGARMTDRWPLHLTTVALLVGMTVAIASFSGKGSTVYLITLAQALTVLGIPILALALIYLGTRPELQDQQKVPAAILIVATLGFLTSCVLAYLTAVKVYEKLS